MINNCKLKIGLDYHGVINNNPVYFSLFCNKLKQRGHSLYIITGGPGLLIKEKLETYEINYDMCFAVSDYYQAQGQISQTKDGFLVIPDNLWNMAKGDFCLRNNINLHIDDSLRYAKYFSTPFCHYDKNTHLGHIFPDTTIDFNISIDKVLDKIEKTISASPKGFITPEV